MKESGPLFMTTLVWCQYNDNQQFVQFNISDYLFRTQF